MVKHSKNIVRKKEAIRDGRFTATAKSERDKIRNVGVYATKPFNSWANRWLFEISKPNLKPSTFSNYYGHMSRHILPQLGDIHLEEISFLEIQDFVTYLSKTGLLPSTAGTVFRILSACLKSARRFREIGANPCDDVVLPSAALPKIDVLNADEQMRLENASQNFETNTHTAIMLSLYIGLRIGEICALKWEDIDFDKNLISINSTIQRIALLDNFDKMGNKTKVVTDKPKSAKSTRQVPMPEAVSEVLKKIEQLDGYVLNKNGKFLDVRTLQYRFKSVLKRAEIRDIKFHVLRHTFATRCVECGIDVKIISEILGHSTVQLTLDRYVHPLMEQKQEAMRSLKRAR